MRDTEKAFYWIIGILERHDIPYKINGGLAARAYGAQRELADIDLDIQNEDIPTIIPEVQPYIVFGPGRYKSDRFDIELLTLNYEGQEIDIAGTEGKIFNQGAGKWENYSDNIHRTTSVKVFGKIVPVEPLDLLIASKKKLGREVDIEDVRQLARND